MSKIETVVVGVDGSPGSQQAVRWAANRARTSAPPSAVRLRLVHVSTPLSLSPGILAEPVLAPTVVAPPLVDVDTRARAVARTLLDSALAEARRAAPEVEVTTDEVVGSVGAALVDASASASLVVLGSRERGAVSALVFGSVGVYVANHAACPTVVVHGRPDRHGPVVLGVDAAEGSLEAATFAVTEARRLGVGVIVVHSVAGPLPMGVAEAAVTVGGEQDADGASAHAVRHLLGTACARVPGVPVEVRVTEDVATDALLDLASAASLLVVGSHGYGSLAGLVIGSTCQAVLRHASCPVGVVRAPVP